MTDYGMKMTPTINSSHNNIGRKIGIVTLPGRYNYGNRLQNYAVTRIWENLGFQPETLVLAERPNSVRTLKRIAKHMLGIVTPPSPESGMSAERLAAFDRFNRNITIRKLDSIERGLADQYCIFSVGSDQVWNPYYMVYNEDWYFLEFARPEQRIALAPSIGVDELNLWASWRIAKGVKGFERLSVREERGAELIKQCSGRSAEVICDPTLVIDRMAWCSVADGRLTPKNPYVLTYLLGGMSEDARRVLDVVTNGGRIPIVPLSDREKPEEPPAGPAEFIDLIGHAEHVVTDSFHAAVFSSILETPLTIVRRGGDGGGIFSRLETLSQALGIESKVFGGEEFDFSKAGDYQGVPDCIASERERFMRFLETSLAGR